ncbi:Protein of unknown function, partial [Gryllus bimaculatus]
MILKIIETNCGIRLLIQLPLYLRKYEFRAYFEFFRKRFVVKFINIFLLIQLGL